MITRITAATRLADRRRQDTQRQPLGSQETGTRLRIAVADGDDGILEDYQGLLKILGHEAVSLSPSGEDLLARCRALEPDLVLVEMALPDADGLDIATEILQHRLIPIVLVTSGYDAELNEMALRSGVLATVAKPFHLAELRDAISHSKRCFDQLDTIRRHSLRLAGLLKR